MRQLACLLLLSAPLIAQQTPPIFKVKANYIKVPVTVIDDRGRIVGDLNRESFDLLDEGEERRIENFVLDKAPVNVVLLLDVSGSLQEEIEEVRDAAYGFVKAFGREDRFAVISFADKVELLQDWTSKPKRVRKSLRKLKPGYRTALWDALLETASRTLQKVNGRKVILLLTDGLDNESYANYNEAVERLVDTDVSLYIVSRTRLVMPKVQQSNRVEFLNRVMREVLKEDTDFVGVYFREKETAMANLAESTGGRIFFPERLKDLRSSYAEVAKELKNQYVLTFIPPLTSEKRFRSIEVRCDYEVGRIFHRRQYSWRQQ